MSTAAALEHDDAFTPAPPKRPLTVTEPARETPVHAETEVLVVGGGPAGFAAALAARRAGAEVLLVERYNHLGGLSTGGLVIWIDRMTDWSGRPVITGIGQELLDRLARERGRWGAARVVGIDRCRARGLLARAPGRVPRHGHVVADDRPGVAEVPVGRDADRGGRQAAVARLGGGSARRGPEAPRRDVREKGGPARDPGRRDRRLHRRSRLCARAGLEFEADAKAGGGGIAHCLNTGWLWAGVDFARWLEFKRERAGRPPAADGRRRRRARVRRAPGRGVEQRRGAVPRPAAERLQRRRRVGPDARRGRVAPADGRPSRPLPPPRARASRTPG